MAFAIVFHQDVPGRDIAGLNRDIQGRILGAIQARLSESPEKYGIPLRRNLRGYWKLRVGQFRVVFRIEGAEVHVLAVGNRKDIYRWAAGRITRKMIFTD